MANYESYVVLDQVDEGEQGGRTVRVASRRTVLYGIAVVAASFNRGWSNRDSFGEWLARHPQRFGLPSRGGALRRQAPRRQSLMNCLIWEACSIVWPGMLVRFHAYGWPR